MKKSTSWIIGVTLVLAIVAVSFYCVFYPNKKFIITLAILAVVLLIVSRTIGLIRAIKEANKYKKFDQENLNSK